MDFPKGKHAWIVKIGEKRHPYPPKHHFAKLAEQIFGTFLADNDDDSNNNQTPKGGL